MVETKGLKFKFDVSENNLTREEKLERMLANEGNKVYPQSKPMFIYADDTLVIPLPKNKYLWFFEHGIHEYLDAEATKVLLMDAEKIYSSGHIMHSI